MSELKVISFECKEDLTPYVDSMLFDSGERIATGVFEKDGKRMTVVLDVCGEVAVTFKGEVYHTPSEFPEELRERIKNNPSDWEVYAPTGEGNDDEDGDIYATLNNWFSLVWEETGEDEVYEDSIYKDTPDGILNKMKEFAEYFWKNSHSEVAS